MKLQVFATGLTIVNLVILSFSLSKPKQAQAQQPRPQAAVEQVVRTRALEIVDSLGHVRASIQILPPVVMNGKTYPETVLLRLTSSKGKPLVKIGAAENGSGLTLTNTKDEGVLIHGHDEGSFLKITQNGTIKEFKP